MTLPPSSRRFFLKLSAASLGLSLSACHEPILQLDFPVEVDASLLRGHRLFEKETAYPPRGIVRKEALVVGAGIAGLTAGCQLRDRDLVVCEVGASLGGSSSALKDFSGVSFAQGAHYELAYPTNFGPEVLALLERLGVIAYSSVTGMWEFLAKEYVIDEKVESRTWTADGNRSDPLPQNNASGHFAELLADFEGKMPLPTRLIKEAYRGYNQISFAAWLQSVGFNENLELRDAIDYQLRDDYGAGAGEVSALAGIHYYRCRPYYSRQLGHFSPPQGNAYFVDLLAAQIPREALHTDHLVTSIQAEEGQPTLLVTVLDLLGNQWKRFRVDQVVYAGQKHALKYVYPADAALFSATHYAPWMTINFFLKRYPGKAFWQNDVLSQDRAFLGFVNSAAQHGTGGTIVLTAYFCLDEKARKELIEVQKDPRPMVERALRAMNRASGERIDKLVTRAAVKVHGHAMPIPTPNYLFRDGNNGRSLTNLVYAGVDNGRLPLLYEALDSGLQAVDLLNQKAVTTDLKQ